MASQEQLNEELKLVNALILDILSRRVVKGQFNGREFTLHNLSDLKAYRDSIEQEIIGVDQGGRQVRQIVPRG